MNVSLPAQLEQYVREKVESGLYSSASEVVREALRLLQEHERDQEAKLAQLRRDIEEGLRDAREGRLLEFDDAGLEAFMKQVLDRSKRAS